MMLTPSKRKKDPDSTLESEDVTMLFTPSSDGLPDITEEELAFIQVRAFIRSCMDTFEI